MRQCVQAESSDDKEEEDNNRAPEYRAPIEKKVWSRVDLGWGDTECIEYLRFSRAEITERINPLGLAEWVDSRVKILGRYAMCTEQTLCVLLYQWSSAGHLKDIMHVFR